VELGHVLILEGKRDKGEGKRKVSLKLAELSPWLRHATSCILDETYKSSRIDYILYVPAGALELRAITMRSSPRLR